MSAGHNEQKKSEADPSDKQMVSTCHDAKQSEWLNAPVRVVLPLLAGYPSPTLTCDGTNTEKRFRSVIGHSRVSRISALLAIKATAEGLGTRAPPVQCPLIEHVDLALQKPVELMERCPARSPTG